MLTVRGFLLSPVLGFQPHRPGSLLLLPRDPAGSYLVSRDESPACRPPVRPAGAIGVVRDTGCGADCQGRILAAPLTTLGKCLSVLTCRMGAMLFPTRQGRSEASVGQRV